MPTQMPTPEFKIIAVADGSFTLSGVNASELQVSEDTRASFLRAFGVVVPNVTFTALNALSTLHGMRPWVLSPTSNCAAG